MANVKKKSDEVKEEPVVIAGDPESERITVPAKPPIKEAASVPVGVPLNEIPLDSLKELLGLLRESYSRSNNRDFRLRCKRIEASVGEFVNAVDKVKNG